MPALTRPPNSSPASSAFNPLAAAAAPEENAPEKADVALTSDLCGSGSASSRAASKAVSDVEDVFFSAREQAIFGADTQFYGWHYPPYFLFVAAPLVAWVVGRFNALIVAATRRTGSKMAPLSGGSGACANHERSPGDVI